MNKLTIAIDGFSGVGKSTFARAIAARLGYVFIDTGAMYRAVTLWALERGFFTSGNGGSDLNEAALTASLPDISIEFKYDPAKGSSDIFLNGENVSGRIRSIEVSSLVSRVSSIVAVRQMLVNQQRTMGREGGVVMDGRDIGTVVFPNADLKIFLTADPAVRARRRFEELRAAGEDVSLAEVERNIRERDAADQSREISPLRQAPDAKVLDNSNLTLTQQMDWVDEQLREINGCSLIARDGLLRIEIDEKSGFCFGVVRAVEMAEAALKEGRSIISLGDIVHNEEEMRRLQQLGLQTVAEDADLADLAGRTVLIRAHGEPPATYQLADNYRITLIDATCPVVAALQRTVASAATMGWTVVIFGRPNHAEVRGLVGQVTATPAAATAGRAMQQSDNVIVIESAVDLEKIDFMRPIYFLAQTTSSLAEFQRLGEEILRRAQSAGNDRVTIHDTVCRQVADREEHLAEFARRHDLVIFVAGVKSSNGRVLFEVVRAANPNAYKIQSVSELQSEWFADKAVLTGVSGGGTVKSVGICGGGDGHTETAGIADGSRAGSRLKNLSVGICGATSTPRWLMEKTAEEIKRITKN